MSTETLKISLAQKILGISDNSLLEKLKAIIEKENIIGYDTKGSPITENQYIQEMNMLINDIDNGTAELYTIEEVKKSIIDENNLE